MVSPFREEGSGVMWGEAGRTARAAEAMKDGAGRGGQVRQKPRLRERSSLIGRGSEDAPGVGDVQVRRWSSMVRG